MNTDKILKYVSLAAAGRNAVFGTDQVLSAIRRRQSGTCVLLSSDASERTAKQIKDKCAFYNVPCITLCVDMEALAKRCGKISPAATAAVTLPSLAREIIKNAED